MLNRQHAELQIVCHTYAKQIFKTYTNQHKTYPIHAKIAASLRCFAQSQIPSCRTKARNHFSLTITCSPQKHKHSHTVKWKIQENQLQLYHIEESLLYMKRGMYQYCAVYGNMDNWKIACITVNMHMRKNVSRSTQQYLYTVFSRISIYHSI